MDWEAIDIAIKGKKKTWLYGLNKADLLKVLTKYKITCSGEEDIDKLRKRLSEYISVVSEKSGPFREVEINAAVKQTIKKISLNLTALESFKKNQSWTSYVIQLKCLLNLSNVTDRKSEYKYWLQNYLRKRSKFYATCVRRTPRRIVQNLSSKLWVQNSKIIFIQNPNTQRVWNSSNGNSYQQNWSMSMSRRSKHWQKM